MKKYNIIYADPPWHFSSRTTSGRDRSGKHLYRILPYPTLKPNQIKALPIASLAAEDCVLFLWTTDAHVPVALEVIEAWGFKYITIAFVWSKKESSGKQVCSYGTWTMKSSEICLLGTKGKPHGLIKSHKVRQLVEAVRDRTKHSGKPDEVRDRIVELVGDLPRIELFAREATEGWDVWGNEVESDNDIQLYHGDCLEIMRILPDGCIDLIITSPPYWNQRSYSYWPRYENYMSDVFLWIKECARLLRSGRHCFWVIPDKLPWPPKENGTRERLYLPIYADTERCAADVGLVCEFPIIWKKPHGTRKMFGSYPYPPTTIHTPMTERICVWRKPGKADLARKGPESRYTKEEWVNWGQDLWNINPETRLKKKHPAPFPVEIPQRIIKLWSFVGDIVLDPFMGAGTTGVACALADRKFIGIEINEGYFDFANQRIRKVQTTC